MLGEELLQLIPHFFANMGNWLHLEVLEIQHNTYYVKKKSLRNLLDELNIILYAPVLWKYFCDVVVNLSSLSRHFAVG